MIRIKLVEYVIDDSDYWEMNHPTNRVIEAIRDYDHWQDLGVEFSVVETTDIAKFSRHIEIWATAEDTTMTLLLLAGFEHR